MVRFQSNHYDNVGTTGKIACNFDIQNLFNFVGKPFILHYKNLPRMQG